MHKFLQISCLVLASLGFSSVAQAFSVEQMSAWSAPNEPLRMDIALSGLSVAYASEVQVRVASEADYSRLGLTRPDWANSVTFQMITLPDYRVVARATSTAAVTDDPVTLLVDIRTPGEGRLQQVGATLGGQPIAAKQPAPERTVAPVPTKPRAIVKVAPSPRAKSYDPSAPVARVASSSATSAQAAPQQATPSALADMAATGADMADDAEQERAALVQGLQAAKAQVTDLEARLAALDQQAMIRAQSAASEAAAADETTPAMSDDTPVESETGLTDDAAMVAEPAELSGEAAAMVTGEAVIEEPVVSTLKPYQLFARFMILVVALILLAFFLIDKVRNRR
ncbi:hypothetical protein DFR26_1796 [Paraperlucidibaca baekdonensis]|uniref:FimV N-terminal domain-containing protein n=1 Tax=Paraperlucidibaca baekdonensis TaxID=748120 RepID=A0A3E0H0V4_9GAMM|nr:hypothetical protein [Paraperlucidibaca baekdonensis]REH36664.1 hypothetical protein DFR26_1796 [Paraperlucidibaca baekdonensis]